MPQGDLTPRSLTEAPHPAVEEMRKLGVDIVYSSRGRLPDEDELLRLVPGVSGWIAGVENISPKVVAAADKLRCISRNGTGIDNLPHEALKSRNIEVRTANGANAKGVAELTLAMMFAALRHLPYTDKGIKAGEWPRKLGTEIHGKVLGIIGCGAVGREVARLGAALGCSIYAHDPLGSKMEVPPGGMRWASAAECFEASDIITLHCPSPADGRPLVDERMLAIARPGLILINTARASLVDDETIMAALDSGRIATYCVDVFEPEPPKLPGLASRPDVIATSHIGGYTKESVARATQFAVANLMECLQLGGL